MKEKTFEVDGRELKTYQLSNEQIIRLLNSEDITDNGYDLLMETVLERFKSECCPKYGETNDNVFVRSFSRFVNGMCGDKDNVAKLMCREHRYLQSEMFFVCMAYIRKMAENYDNGNYDLRNKYACKTAKQMISAL